MVSVLRSDIFPYILFIVCFVPVLLNYYFDVPILKLIDTELRGWSTLILLTALFLGLANITIYNYREIKRREPGKWQFGVYSIVLTYAWIIYGLASGGLLSPAYAEMYTFVKGHAEAAMIGLLTFFFVTAVFRTFKVRNLQSLVLLIFTLITFLGMAPWAEVLWKDWPTFAGWVLDSITMAGSRAMILAASVGLVIIIARIILRYEKRGLGGG
jgi:hypothetical protein